MLDDILARLSKLDKAELDKVIELKNKAIGRPVWVPNPGPQTDAYLSEADILLYGGEPGGGKTGLGLGLALTQHRRSLVIRKQFTDLDGVIDNLAGLLPSNKGLVRGNRPKYKKPDGGLINFQGMGQSGELDTGKQGNPHDLIFIDEAAQSPENDIRLLIGWNRTTEEGQRCRIVLGSNPPLNSTGDWLGAFFAPWLDSNHPNPAKFGELRWFIFDQDGNSKEVSGKNKVVINNKDYTPHSRTYIPARLEDNPYINATEYRKNLQTIPEPFRTMLLSGNFLAARQDQDSQVIPTLWVQEAVERWTKEPNPPIGVPMCALAADIAQGGTDSTVISSRYDYWFSQLVKIPGKETPLGRDVAGHIVKHRTHNALTILDMGGGFGSGAWECLVDNIGSSNLRAYKGAEAGSGRTKDKQLSFFNKRSQAYWMMREALDPSQLGGSPICLPNDRELIADLTAPTFEITPRGIKVESKEDVVKKLGRSPDSGDAVVMCWIEGQRGLTPKANYNSYSHRNSRLQTKAVLGYANRRR